MDCVFSDLVYKVVSHIPKGKVSTYKQVAEMVNRLNSGIKIHPRIVGRILHYNSDPNRIPCHRVVFWNGSLSENYAFGEKNAQKEKLEKEGVVFVNGKVLLDSCLWKKQD